jgi:hypothetical protein
LSGNVAVDQLVALAALYVARLRQLESPASRRDVTMSPPPAPRKTMNEATVSYTVVAQIAACIYGWEDAREH